MTRKIGIVTGLQSEAKAARTAGARLRDAQAFIDVACEGPGLEAASRAAATLLARGARILVSFGFAGGLGAGLSPGALVLPRRVISADSKPLVADTASADSIAFALASALKISRGDLLSLDLVITTPADKAALAEASAAVAVDMESFAVARAADAAGVPFLVLRAIADPAGRALPPAALKGMGPDGRIRPLAVMRALIGEPSAAQAVMKLGRDTELAMKSLSRALRLALPILLIGG
jgi:adenosylhomocysteine nucleosidase